MSKHVPIHFDEADHLTQEDFEVLRKMDAINGKLRRIGEANRNNWDTNYAPLIRGMFKQ